MTFTGYIFREGIIPWTKVFGIDFEPNARFTSHIFDDALKTFVECDLYGIVKHAFRTKNFDIGLDEYFNSMFNVCGANIRAALTGSHNPIVFDGKCISSEDLSQPKFNTTRTKNAQLVVIDHEYVYFCMTSYEFWESVEIELGKEFNSNNLGGCLVKIGHSKAVDSCLKEIL